MEKIEELRKQREELTQQIIEIEKAEQAIIEASVEIKVGDVVECVRIWHNDYDDTHEWVKEKVYKIEKDKDGNTFVYVGNHVGRKRIEDVKLFDSEDYKLRHSLWDHEMELEECFQLIVDKPKCTKGKRYSVIEIHKRIGSPIEYWFYNDHDKPQTLYEGQFHVVQPKD